MAKQILLIDDAPTQVAIFIEAMQAGTHKLQNTLSIHDDFSSYALATNPDILLFNIKKPSAILFDKIKILAAIRPTAIIVFTQTVHKDDMEKAIKAGVNAFIVDGLRSNRVNAIIEIALARFKEQQLIKNELKQARETLEERKIIERAKGLLMESRNMSEKEAYQAMRKMAMDQNKKMIEIANNVLSVMQLLSVNKA